jgi:DNA polymerase III delta prime subunit
MMGEQFIWTEKYRPKTIKDTILPVQLQNVFQQFVDQKNIPNLLLTGVSGIGKTTVARALCEQLECDYILINGSKDGGIDTLRTTIQQFASSMSLTGGRKYIILDEADYLNPQSTQPALRGFIEEYSKNCGFIFTCNFKEKIILALHSRCSVIDFKIQKKEAASLATKFFERILFILDTEKIIYDRKVIIEFINRYYPDWRRCINELQAYSSNGKIDSGILSNVSNESYKSLVKYLKEKDFTLLRKWVVDNEADSSTIFRKIYDLSNEYMPSASIAELVLIIGKYQFQAAFVADHQLNLIACLVEIMATCSWK